MFLLSYARSDFLFYTFNFCVLYVPNFPNVLKCTGPNWLLMSMDSWKWSDRKGPVVLLFVQVPAKIYLKIIYLWPIAIIISWVLRWCQTIILPFNLTRRQAI